MSEVGGSNVTVTNNSCGGIVTGNGSGGTFGGVGGGIAAGRMSLVDSMVTGNLFCGAPLDLQSTRRPKLVNTTCGYSRDRSEPAPASFGICTND